jgi:hypothetical protein
VEQQREVQKQNLSVEMSDLYTRMFKQFIKSAIYELPPELAVLNTAFGVDKERILIDSVVLEIEKLVQARQNTPCEEQMTMFDLGIFSKGDK